MSMVSRSRSRSRSGRKRGRRSEQVSQSRSLSLSSRNRQVAKPYALWPYQTTGTYLRGFDPVPSRLTVRMRYAEVITINTVQGAVAVFNSRANSIFDPNSTGTGHQPYGHDLWQQVYNHYRVVRATFTASPLNSTGRWGVILTDDGALTSQSFDSVAEVKGQMCATQISGAPNNLSIVYDSNAVFGDKYEQQASFGSNPTDAFFFTLWATGLLFTDAASTRSFQVTISYDVEMWELKEQAES